MCASETYLRCYGLEEIRRCPTLEIDERLFKAKGWCDLRTIAMCTVSGRMTVERGYDDRSQTGAERIAHGI